MSTNRLTPHDIALDEGRNLFQNVMEVFILHPEHAPEQMSPHCVQKIIPVQTIPSPECDSIVLDIHDDNTEEDTYLTVTGLVCCLRLKSPSLECIHDFGVPSLGMLGLQNSFYEVEHEPFQVQIQLSSPFTKLKKKFFEGTAMAVSRECHSG